MPEEELEDKVEVSEEFVEERRVTEKVSVKYYDQHSSPGSSFSRSVNPESSTLQMEHRTLGSTIHQDLDELDQLKGTAFSEESDGRSFDFRFATTTESRLPPHKFDGSLQMDYQMETSPNATGHKKRMGSGDRPPEEERFTVSKHDFEDVQVSQDPQMPPANPVNVSHDQSTFNPIDKHEKESTLLAHECNAGSEGEVTEVPSASLINEHEQEYSDSPEDGQNSSRDRTEGTQEGTVNEDISYHCLEHRHQTFKITEHLECIQEEILEYREDKEGHEEVHMAGDRELDDQKMILTPKKKEEETSSDLHLSYETGLPYDSSVSENIQPRDEQHDVRTLTEESGIEEQDRSQTEQGVKEQNQEEEQDRVRRTEEEEAENDEANLLEKNIIPFATLHEVESGVMSSQAYISTNDDSGECSSDINIQSKEEACIDLNSDSNQLTDGKICPDSRLEKEEPLQTIDSTLDKERGNYNNENRNQEFFEEIQPSEKVCDTGAVSVEEDVDNNYYHMISDEPTDLTKKNGLKDMNTEDRMLLVFDNLDGEDKVSTEEVSTTDQLKQTDDVEQSSPEHLQRKEEWTEEEEILKGLSTMAKEDVTKDDAEQTDQENVPQTFSAAPTDDNTSHLLQEQSTAVDCVEEPKHAQENVMTENSEPNASVKQRGMEPAEGSLAEEFHGGDLKDSIEDANEKEENSVEKDGQDRYEEGKDVYLTDSSNISSSKNDGESEETKEGTSVGPTEDSTTEDFIVEHLEQQMASGLSDSKAEDESSKETVEIRNTEPQTESQSKKKKKFGSTRRPQGGCRTDNDEEERKRKDVKTTEGIQFDEEERCSRETTHHAPSSDLLTEPLMSVVSEMPFSVLEPPLEKEMAESNSETGLTDKVVHQVDEDMNKEEEQSVQSVLEDERGDEPTSTDKQELQPSFTEIQDDTSTYCTSPQEASVVVEESNIECTENGNPIQLPWDRSIPEDHLEQLTIREPEAEQHENLGTLMKNAEPQAENQGEVSLGILELPSEKEVAESEDETGLTDIVVQYSDNTLNKVEELVENIEEQSIVDDEKVNKLTEEELEATMALEERDMEKSKNEDHLDQPINRDPEAEPHEITCSFTHTPESKNAQENVMTENSEPNASVKQRGMEPAEGSLAEEFHGGDLKDSIEDANEKEENSVEKDGQDRYEEGKDVYLTDSSNISSSKNDAVAEHSDSKKEDGNSKETVEMRTTELQTESQNTAHLLTEPLMSVVSEMPFSVLEPPLEKEMAESNNEIGLTDKEASVVVEESNIECTESGNPIQLPWDRSIPEDHLEQLTNREPEAEQHENSGTLMKNAEPQAENQEGIEHDEGERYSKETTHQAAASDMLAEPLSVVVEELVENIEEQSVVDDEKVNKLTEEELEATMALEERDMEKDKNEDHLDQPINKDPEAEPHEITCSFTHTPESKNAQENVMTENSEPNASVKQRGMEPAEGSLAEEFHGGDLKDSTEDANEKEENSVEKDGQDRYEEGKDVYLTDSSNISSSKNDTVAEHSDSKKEDGNSKETVEMRNTELQTESQKGYEQEEEEICSNETTHQADTAHLLTEQQIAANKEASVVVEESNLELTETGNPIQLPWDRSIPEDHLEQLTNREPEAEQHENSGTLMKNAEPQAENQEGIEHDEGERYSKETTHQAAASDMLAEPLSVVVEELVENIEEQSVVDDEKVNKLTEEELEATMALEERDMEKSKNEDHIDQPINRDPEAEPHEITCSFTHAQESKNAQENVMTENSEPNASVKQRGMEPAEGSLAEEFHGGDLKDSIEDANEKEENSVEKDGQDRYEEGKDVYLTDSSNISSSKNDAVAEHSDSKKEDGNSKETVEMRTTELQTESQNTAHLLTEPLISVVSEMPFSVLEPPLEKEMAESNNEIGLTDKEASVVVEESNIECTESGNPIQLPWDRSIPEDHLEQLTNREPEAEQHENSGTLMKNAEPQAENQEGIEHDEGERYSKETTHQAAASDMLAEPLSVVDIVVQGTDKVHKAEKLEDIIEEHGQTVVEDEKSDESTSTDEQKISPAITKIQNDTFTYHDSSQETSSVVEGCGMKSTENGGTSQGHASPTCGAVVLISEIQDSLDIPVNTDNLKKENSELKTSGKRRKMGSTRRSPREQLHGGDLKEYTEDTNENKPKKGEQDDEDRNGEDKEVHATERANISNRKNDVMEDESEEIRAELKANPTEDPTREDFIAEHSEPLMDSVVEHGKSKDNTDTENTELQTQSQKGIEQDEEERCFKETTHYGAFSNLLTEPLSAVWKAEEHGQTVVEDEKSDESTSTDEQKIPPVITKIQNDTSTNHDSSQEISFIVEGCGMENTENGGPSQGHASPTCGAVELISEDNLKKENSELKTSGKRRKMGSTRRSPREQLHGGDLKEYTEDTNENKPKTGEQDDEDRNGEEKEVHATERANISNRKNDVMEDESEEIKGELKANPTEDPTREDFKAEHSEPLMDSVVPSRTTELGLSTNVQPSPVAEHSDFKVEHGKSKDNTDTENTELQTQSQKGIEQDEEERCSKETTHYGAFSDVLTEKPKAVCELSLEVLIEESMERHSEPSESINIPRPEPEKLDKKKRKMGSTRRNLNGGDAKKAWERGTGDTDPKADTNIATDPDQSEGSLLSEIESELKKSCLSPLNTTALGILEISLNSTGNSQQDTSEVPEPTAEHNKSTLELPLSQSSQAQPERSSPGRRRKMGSTRKTPRDKHSEELRDESRETEQETPGNSELEMENSVQIITEDPKGSVDVTAEVQAISQTDKINTEHPLPGGRRKFGSRRKAKDDFEHNQKETQDDQVLTDELTVCDPESTLISQPAFDHETTKPSPANEQVERSAGNEADVSTGTGLVSLDDLRKSALYNGSTESREVIDFDSWNELPVFEVAVYNIVMVGNCNVGKTSFIRRFQSGLFSQDHGSTIGVDTFVQTITLGNRTVKLNIWDTAGQERYYSITRQVFHKAQGLLLMYDITSSESFCAVRNWISQIQERAPADVIMMLLGNKNDCAERKVRLQDGEALARDYNIHFMECSAATGENVSESLKSLACRSHYPPDSEDPY
ncbi:hypothetical protein NFI96_009605 [Prochilodus magdalenae]|nr:hypothetical protein NFI96_009605 [Prochilodus magdalenae]